MEREENKRGEQEMRREEEKVKGEKKRKEKKGKEMTRDKRQENIKEEKRIETIRTGLARRNRRKKNLCEYFDLGFRGWRNETFHISDSLTISVISISVFYFIYLSKFLNVDFHCDLTFIFFTRLRTKKN